VPRGVARCGEPAYSRRAPWCCAAGHP
jgi:hypothetical protein